MSVRRADRLVIFGVSLAAIAALIALIVRSIIMALNTCIGWIQPPVVSQSVILYLYIIMFTLVADWAVLRKLRRGRGSFRIASKPN